MSTPVFRRRFVAQSHRGGARPLIVPPSVTFDPAAGKTGAGLLLTNGNQTVESTNGTWKSSYSTVTRTGKLYVEGVWNVDGGGSVAAIGFADASLSAENPIGQDGGAKKSFGYSVNSIIRYNDGVGGVLAGYSVGNTIGVACDFTLSPPQVWADINGTWQGVGDPSAGAGIVLTGWLGTGPYHGAMSVNGDKWTENFNASGFKPAGYTTMSGN